MTCQVCSNFYEIEDIDDDENTIEGYCVLYPKWRAIYDKTKHFCRQYWRDEWNAH